MALGRLLLISLVLLLISFPAALCASGSGSDYPGLDDQDRRDIETIRALGRPLVYGSLQTSEAFLGQDGQIQGFSALFGDWLGDLLGLEIKVEILEWEDLLKGLESGAIDFTGELTPTEERRQKYLMTGPIAERLVKYIRHHDAESLDMLANSRPLRFGFFSGSTTLADVSALSPYAFEPSLFSESEPAYAALTDGSIDAFIAEGVAAASFDTYLDLTASDFMPLIYSEVSLSTANPDLEPVIRIVQKLLRTELPRKLVDFYNEGERQYLRHRFFLSLDQEETEFLSRHDESGQPILYGAENDNYPISFYNENEGEFQGIAIDAIAEIGSVTGLNLKRLNDAPVDWQVLLDQAESGQVAFLTEIIQSPERMDRYIWPEHPLMVDKFALLSLADTSDRKLNEVLLSRVGLIERTAYAEVFRQWYPNHGNVLSFQTNQEAFDALENGEVDLLMGTRNLNLSMTNFMEKPWFKVNLVFNQNYYSAFGFNKDQTVLCSIIDKATSVIDSQTISERWTRKTFDYSAKVARSRVPWLLGLSAMLVALLIMSAIFIHRHQGNAKILERLVQERTREMEAQKEEAQLASKAKGEFLARMSHEIRTPMNAIIGMAELVLREEISDEIGDMVGNIRQAGNALLAIINDILDFSKIESGKLELIEVEYQLGSLVHDVINVISTKLADQPLDFLVEVDNELPSAMLGDEIRIRQILLNLLSNAVKYTKEGFIRLTVDGQVDGDVVRLSFRVADSGRGIRPEDMRKLFGDFTQFDQEANRGIEGSGLGLAITKNLVSMMGGTVTAESVYGEGSAFSATIVQKRLESAPLASLRNKAKARVLVVERRSLLSKSLAWSLGRLGAPLVQTVGVVAAAAEISSGRYNFLVASESLAEFLMPLARDARPKIRPIFFAPLGGRPSRIEHSTVIPSPVFCLPLANAINDARTSVINRKASGKVSFTAPKARVLIVDDMEINLKVAKGLMTPFKVQVDLCTSGAQAMDMIRANAYDLIFMDHMMPEMDGLKATLEIRKMPQGATVPIIALTANAVSGVREMFLASGMNDFISKPIELAKLEGVLDHWIPREKRFESQADPAD
jgi:signal transduction histidine kinase/ActR/RegA family two-component response regulator